VERNAREPDGVLPVHGPHAARRRSLHPLLSHRGDRTRPRRQRVSRTTPERLPVTLAQFADTPVRTLASQSQVG